MPLPEGGKAGERSKPEDLQGESIAHITFEEELESLFYFNIFIMRAFRIIKLCLTGCIVALLPFCELFSQNTDDVRLLDTLQVVGNRHDTGLVGSSVPKQQLTSQQMQRLGVTNAGDALKYFSGVTVKDYGGVGGLKTVSIRGMGAQHTAVLYDGVAVGDCQSGQVDLGRFSTDNLNTLQFTIGQGDDIYQTARIMASVGAVSLETPISDKNLFKANARAGSYGFYQANMSAIRNIGKGWQFGIFGDYMTADGDYDFDLANVNGHRNNSDVESVRGEFNLSRIVEQHSFRAKLYGYCSSRGLPGSVIVDNPQSNERLLSRNFFAQLSYEYIHSSFLKMKFALKHNYAYDRNKQFLAAGDVRNDEFVQNESDFSYTVKWSPVFLHGFSFAFAEELFYNRLTTTNTHVTMSACPERLTALSAISARYSGNSFTATASLLHTFADEYASKGEVAPVRRRFSPAFSMSFFPFGENLSLRFSYKDIFRLPTFNDLYYRQVGNYKLKPEKSRMLNAGVAYNTALNGWLGEFSISTDLYYGCVKDKIVAVPGIFVWKMSNVDEVALSGVDVNLSGKIVFSSEYNMEFASSYSYMHAVDDTEGSSNKGDQIIYTPLHLGSASAVLLTPFCNIGYTLVWSGVRYRLAQNIPSNEIDSFFDHSLWLSREWNIGRNSRISAKIELQNIADDNYEIVRYYPMQGRNVRASFMLTL